MGLVRALQRVYRSIHMNAGQVGNDMPSFDVVSDFDSHEANNAVDQANREVNTRFDFKGSGSKSKRGINIACLEEQEAEVTNNGAQQKIILRRGIDADRARKLVKQIKTEKLKVQTAIQGDKLRVSGKKRDDLQNVIAMLKEFDTGLPLQYENFRD